MVLVKCLDGWGSGVIIDVQDMLILTCAHVVKFSSIHPGLYNDCVIEECPDLLSCTCLSTSLDLNFAFTTSFSLGYPIASSPFSSSSHYVFLFLVAV